MGIGATFAVGAFNYQIGNSLRMGPGYFPLLLGIALALLGLAVSATSFTGVAKDGDKIGPWAWRPLGFVILSNVVFGILLGGVPSIGFPSFGLIIAIYALTFIAALAGDEFKFKEVLILATVLAAGSYGAFIWGLNLQFPAWPSFIKG